MVNDYLISIIVPVYKTENVLQRCIDSCLGQSYSNFELILVDDGSPDNCPAICDNYVKQDNRVVVFHKENGGCASAKNYGIEQAKGKYITFVDSDDFIDQNYLQELIKANNDESDLVIGGLKYLKQEKLVSEGSLNLPDLYFNQKDYGKYVSQLLDVRALNYHVAKLYKRNIVIENGIRFTDFRKTGGDDTVFNFDVLGVANTISVTSANIYNYIYYSSSTSHQYTGDRWSRGKVLDKFLRTWFTKWGIHGVEAQNVLDKRVVNLAYWASQEIAQIKQMDKKKKIELIKDIAQDETFQKCFRSIQNRCEYPQNSRLLYKKQYAKFISVENGDKSRWLGKIYSMLPTWIINIYRKIKRRKGE